MRNKHDAFSIVWWGTKFRRCSVARLAAASVPVAWKPGGIEGAQTAWGLVNVPGGAYAIAIMVNYGVDDPDMERSIREISSAAYKYFTQIARTTLYGTRVPLESIKK